MRLYKVWISTLFFLLVGCTPQTGTASLKSGSSVSVSIHGVNYTADPFEFVVIDPNDASNTGGGEHVGPFAAGGIMCCFTLPSKWSPGMKVQVRSTHWLPKNEKGELPMVEKVHTVEVPPYASGKAGELWVLRTAEGGIDVVSSDLQPDHPQWPGKVKGWPVPSKAYMLERWQLHHKLAEHSVRNYRDLIAELASNPSAAQRAAWEVDKQSFSDEVSAFKGPDDPAYAKYLKQRYEEGLRDSEARLESMKREKP
jgi:hypothetical protein